LKGSGNIAVVMDEMAHFSDAGVNCAEAVYQALRPSISGFHPKGSDKSDGRIVCSSSPLGPEGFFYGLFQKGMFNKDERRLVLRIPTWEMNPTIPLSEISEFYNLRDPDTFKREFGAEFINQKEGNEFLVEGEKVSNPVFVQQGMGGIVVFRGTNGKGWRVLVGNVERA
jgi:hypothetical protein